MVQLLFIVCLGFATWCGIAAHFYVPYPSCKVDTKTYKHSDLVLERSTWCEFCYCLEGNVWCRQTKCIRFVFPEQHSCTDKSGDRFDHGEKPAEEIPCYCIDGVIYCVYGTVLKPRYG